MKRLIPALLLLSVVTAVAMELIEDNDLSQRVVQKSDLQRVTDRPQFMMPAVALLCASISDTGPHNPHESKYYHVYISKGGLPMMQTGQGIYPKGTIILKEKFGDAAGKITELFTGMIKREEGFNPSGGNWEYFVLSGDKKTVLARGTIQSCMACHDSYKSSDYVTRAYMNPATDSVKP